MDEEELNNLKRELEEMYESPMKLAMVQLHEMYTELQAAGFTRREAMFLVSKLMNSMIVGGPSETNQTLLG